MDGIHLFNFFVYSLQQSWMRQHVQDVISTNLERNANVIWRGSGEENIVRCYHLLNLHLLTEKRPIPAESFEIYAMKYKEY